ncbi:MAG: hypothetical protein AAB676_04830 [Verrucomicrobiota bacterium]
MKTIPIISIYVSFLAVAFGQGSVDFRNRVFSQGGWAVDAPFFDDQGVLLEGPSYVAQLYYWRIGEGFQAAGSPVSFATNGYFYDSAVELPFVQECAPVWVQVRAWLLNGSTNFEQAVVTGAWSGVSSVLFLPYTGSPSRPEGCIHARLFGLQYPGSPLVVRQPQAQTVTTGQRVTLSVIASSGVQMGYQWRQQPSDRPDGLIPGATNTSYTTSVLRTNTTFWVSVANSAGSVLSDRVTVTVVSRAPRLIVSQVSGLPVLIIDGVAGMTYRIESSTSLGLSNWTGLADVTLQSSPFTFVDVPAINARMRFYRAAVR